MENTRSTTIMIGESGSFDSQDLALGQPFVILKSVNPASSSIQSNIKAIINSIVVVVSGSKYDIDLLFFNQELSNTGSFVNNQPVSLSFADAKKCISKLRIENNGSGTSDDYLNQVGDCYIASLFNLNIPLNGSSKYYCAAVYQDTASISLNNNTSITINYSALEQ